MVRADVHLAQACSHFASVNAAEGRGAGEAGDSAQGPIFGGAAGYRVASAKA